MKNKMPTPEQQKAVWRWCGLVEQETDSWYTNTFPAEFVSASIPDLDLNSLFKYAVPKLTSEFWITLQHGYDNPSLWNAEINFVDDTRTVEGENKDPALALFWAIYQVMELTQK